MPAPKVDGITLNALRLRGIGDHVDVDLTGLADNEVLVFDLASGNWLPEAGPAPGPHDLTSHTDVTLTAPATGDVIRFDGALWVNVASDEVPAHAASHMLGGSDPVTSFDPLTVGDIVRSVATSTLHLSGGTTVSLGANIVLHGQTDMPANNIEFRTGTTVRLLWDDSVPAWNFQGLNIANLGDIATSGARMGTVFATTVDGTSLVGAGSGITALNADNLATGTVATARGGLGIDTSGVTAGGLLHGAPSAGNWSVLSLGADAFVLTVSGGDSVWAAANAHLHDAEDINSGTFRVGDFTFQANLNIGGNLISSAAIPVTFEGTDTTNESGLLVKGRAANAGGAITATGIMLRLQGFGHDSVAYRLGAEIEFESTNLWSPTNRDAQINFKTTSTSGDPTTRWSIGNTGTLIPFTTARNIAASGARMGTIFATTVDGTSLVGAGSGITNLDAANLATNTVPAARLSMTTNGDLITQASGVTARVGLGATGFVLTAIDANGFGWAAVSVGNHNINGVEHTGTPLNVNKGGTGRVSLTDEGILVGQGTSDPSSLTLLQGALVTSTSTDPPFIVARLARGSNNQFLRVSGSNLAWETLVAADIPAHDLTSAHSESGLTVGHFLKALTTTTFGFADHGLTFTDVGALGATAQATDSAKLAGLGLSAVRTHAPASHTLDSHTGDLAVTKIAEGPADTILKTIVSTPTWSSLVAADIPNLNASKINAGTFADARIPNLNASKINAGVFNVARIPDINASKVIAGSFPTGTFTFTGVLVNFNGQAVSPLHVYTGTQTGTFTPNWNNGNVQKLQVGASALTIAIEGSGNNMNEGGVYTLIVGGGAGTLSFSGVDWGTNGAPGSPGSTVAIMVGFVRSGNGFTLGFIIGEGYPDPT